MLQNALTVITKIKPGELETLRAFLLVVGRDIKGKRDNSHVHFANMHTTHFARWVIINEYGAPHLLFSSNHDGSDVEYIALLIEIIAEALDHIWGHCEGYPSGMDVRSPQFKAAFTQYLLKHAIEPDTFYIGYRGVRVNEMQGFLKLRLRLEQTFDLPAVRAAVSEALPHFPLLSQTTPAFVALRQNMRSALILARVLWDTIVQFLYLVFIKPQILRARGLPRIDYVVPPPEAAALYKAEIEDVVAQNQMTVITRIKPGRSIPLKLVLCFVNAAAKHIFNEGSLANIATIHFARWIIIDDGKHLLFESNYDSTFESYIGDFVDKVSHGMNAIWRHSEGFPETTGFILTQGGCNHIEAFKTYIRQNQIEAQVFYSAYPQHTVRNLISALRIGQTADRGALEAWLSRF
ncbi:MAG: hypothetical protein HXY40_05630 [Chloroflexi bacterium]|nr:hypothetical protein [Chloroflexota bacterium]